MSDTKALEKFTQKWMWLENVHGLWSFQGVPPIAQAAAELKEMERQVEQANWFRSQIDKDETWKTIAQLRAELDEARKFIEEEAFVTLKARMWLEAHPEETK